MSESKTSEYGTSFNNNDSNVIPTMTSQEPFIKFCEPNISRDSQKKDYLKNMYKFVTQNEKENFNFECPKEDQLPNYIVPVLYVPQRIVTNEELLQVTQFRHPHVKAARYTTDRNKKSKAILTDSENEIYQRLTNKLNGITICGPDQDNCATYNKTFFKNPYEYNNPHYTITSNSENYLFLSSSQNKSCPILSKSATSNDVSRMTDNTQNVSNIKSHSKKNKNTATSKGDSYKKHSIKRVHCIIPKFVPHLQSKVTQTKHKIKQISTQTKIKEEETYNVNALLDSKTETKNFSSCANIPELLEDGIEIISEDFMEASLIPLVSSPLDEIMTPKLRTHSNI